MNDRGTYVKQATTLVMTLSCIALSSIGGADSAIEKRTSIADQELFFAPVPKAVCGPGDKPESGLQGQVPIALRMQPGGFQGFSCNLQLLAQVRGEGATWQNDEWREGKGKTKKVCAYHGTQSPEASVAGRVNYGVRSIDITNPAAPVNTAYLTTKAMLYPHEALKVNERRQLLATVRGDGGPEFDVYDVGGDCRYPQLLSSVVLQSPDGNLLHRFYGHEGSWAPDGLTYYGSDLTYNPTGTGPIGQYYAIDTTDTTKPSVITSWRLPDSLGQLVLHHGLSISDDGNRAYVVSGGNRSVAYIDPSLPPTNGLLIYDVSDIQARRANPQAKLISSLLYQDGGVSQHTIPITINKKPYIVFVDEGGSARGDRTQVDNAAVCAAGLIPFPLARIIDISDEKNPRIISKLMLEIHNPIPATCDIVNPDLVYTGGVFTYGSHYCSVDSRTKATTLACGYFWSGIRVFDIRDPIRPREIAYYNPPATNSVSPGSSHAAQRAAQLGGPDWCAGQVHLDAEQGTLWTACMDNGLLSLKFTHNAWPFAESRTPPGRQN
jgi:hypothetical protein